MTAALVMGFDMEQIRKIASRCIGLPASRSAMPRASNQATFPWRTTIETAPAMRLSSTSFWTAVAMRPRRSGENPSVPGSAEGRSCEYPAESRRSAQIADDRGCLGFLVYGLERLRFLGRPGSTAVPSRQGSVALAPHGIADPQAGFKVFHGAGLTAPPASGARPR